MATHDYVIDNATGSNFRNDINNAFNASVTQNSSDTEPETKYPHMVWADTANDVLKVRNAANSEWLPVYTLSTGVPVAGGGGSSILPADTALGIINYQGPQTIQLAATPIASTGVSYVAGDVFFAYCGRDSVELEGYLCVALKSFTFKESLNAFGHIQLKDLYCVGIDSVPIANKSVQLPNTGVVTSVTIDIQDSMCFISDIKCDVDVTPRAGAQGVITAGTSFNIAEDNAVLLIPWMWKTSMDSRELLHVQETDAPMGIPVASNGWGGRSVYNSKLVTGWEESIGIVLGITQSTASTSDKDLLILLNGESYTLPEWLPFFSTVPNALDPVYWIANGLTSVQNEFSYTTNRFSTTPIDGNSIRIGTWQAGNILTVGIA